MPSNIAPRGGLLIYCMKCRAKTDTNDLSVQRATHREGLVKISGKCVTCGTKKIQFDSKSKYDM